jgi:type I restriction enzyme, S subunit
MACSGQIYGLNGSVCLATEAHSGTFFSHDLIRIRPKQGGPRAGYIATALSHPALGRPLLIREAYGTSIPHLDPSDVAAFPLVRLTKKREEALADAAEEAAAERGKADVKERKLANDAGTIVSDFLKKTAVGPVAI